MSKKGTAPAYCRGCFYLKLIFIYKASYMGKIKPIGLRFFRGIACISFRCRMGKGRFFQFSFLPAPARLFWVEVELRHPVKFAPVLIRVCWFAVCSNHRLQVLFVMWFVLHPFFPEGQLLPKTKLPRSSRDPSFF